METVVQLQLYCTNILPNGLDHMLLLGRRPKHNILHSKNR
ncbi:hypothetical protein SAMN05444359_1428 [Neolewinella agarilytica]|uniref:Uncharacterized protein n=1 Tax=Neolewinella agarilytica TaxID=478744 RepID=A0A1H9P2Y9_9BACT|nr:hypothetical protein SAMN05444359_1428 [Neolewinella agarilytica]